MSVRDWGIPGIHHTRVEGRVVNAHGAAMAGASVRLAASPFTAIALYETRTGPHGDFEFPDVSYDGALQGMVDPPAGWLPATFQIAEVCGVFQAGEIRLKPSAALRVVFETAPGQIFRGDPTELRLSVTPDAFESLPAVTSYADGVFTIDRIPCGRAKLEIEYKETSYTARLALDAGTRHRVIVARLPSSPDENRKLEIVQMIRPWEAPPPQTIQGTVRTPDGSPIDGAEVVIQISMGRIGSGPTQIVVTDAVGQYHAEVPRGTTTTVQLPGDDKPSSATDIQTGLALSVEAVVEGPDRTAPAQARVRWSGPMGWRTLGRGRTWIAPFPAGAAATVQFVADLPGYFPIFSHVELPEPPAVPPPVAERFHFQRGPMRTLAVRAAGKALPGATVEVVRIGDPTEPEQTLPVSYKTGPDGTLRLAGVVEGHYGVLVYARGYRTGRALWSAGAPLVIDLMPESAVLEVAGLTRGEKMRVRHDPGDSALAAMVVEQRPAAVTVAPAQYEVLALDEAGGVTSAAHATAIAGQTTRVALGGSRSAEIRVTVPDPDRAWNVIASPVADTTPEEMVEAQTDRGVTVMPVRMAGRYSVRASRDAGQWLKREIDVPEGGVAMTIPPITASITSVDSGTGEGSSGLLILQPAEPGGWSVVLGEIGPDEGQHHDSRGLPPGKYYAWRPVLDPKSPGGLSGIPVVLEAGRTLAWKDPPRYAGPPLKIRVTGADGRPVPDALLYVDVPAMGHWMSGPAMFSDPEPMPQTLVSVRNGKAELPAGGAGRLLFELLSERGRIYSLTADVGPGRTLDIRLPKEER
ncbi:MAG: carboxypeptidase-like regulatory domain-containing protein [Bryobacteraceae bacterium]